MSHGSLAMTHSHDLSLTVYSTLSFRFRTLSLTCDGDATVLAPPVTGEPVLPFCTQHE